MNLLLVGANFRTAPVEVRERLAIQKDALPEVLRSITRRFGGEAVLLSTCNRVEFYLATVVSLNSEGGAGAVDGSFDHAASTWPEAIINHLSREQGQDVELLKNACFILRDSQVIKHLFRVSASLDSLVLGESQIAGQVKEAHELAQQVGTVGPVLHGLFQQARRVARRVQAETGLTEGKVSVSSLAVDYLTQVFERFDDKTVLVIGAGKMGSLTLRYLQRLRPRQIIVTNRSHEKAAQVAAECGGTVLPWEQLDAGLVQADIILSTTGAAEPIVTYDRFKRLSLRRRGRPVAILDIAVPRDFDPRIARLDIVDLLKNVDDFHKVRDLVLRDRFQHIPAAEAIVDAEVGSYLKDWSRRKTGPAITRLSRDCDAIRQEVEAQCMARLNGKLSAADQATISGALRLLQNKLLHAPISVLQEEAQEGRSKGLIDALLKLFRLGER
jgi:glutamyl-tRNA reductase